MNIEDKDTVLAYWRIRGVSEDALEDLYTIALAVNKNDDAAMASGDPGPVVESAGWNREAAEYMTEQRGLRIAVLVERGPEGLAKLTAGFAMGATDEGLRIAARLAWLDGFAAAATAYATRNQA